MRRSRFQPINDAVSSGLKVRCVVLRGFKGLLRWQTQTDTYFSREISDRVRVIACLSTLPNIMHSDSMSESIPSSEWSMIKKAVGAGENDTLVIVWGDDRDSVMGGSEIIIRAKEATIGIPSETRQALSDGTNGFERILPGPERMYPDTDLPPIRINQERYDKIKSGLPKSIWGRISSYSKLGFEYKLAEEIATSDYADIFDNLINNIKVEPEFASFVLVNYRKRLKKEGFDFAKLKFEDFSAIFSRYQNAEIVKEGVLQTIRKAIENGTFSESMLPKSCGDEELNEIIKNSVAELNKLKINKIEFKNEFLMGLVMNKVRGRIAGSKVFELINKGN
jgi:glutamyl-tRNA(Gln) amidotransferase subunit E